MSSFHHRSAFEGSRKPHKHKGKSKPSAQNKPSGRPVPTPKSDRKFQHSSQWRDVGKAQRRATAMQRRQEHREKTLKNRLRYFGKIQGGVPKIVAIVPLSVNSQCTKIKHAMLRHCNINPQFITPGPIPCTAQIGSRKANFIIWECGRNKWSVLDICKVADIVLLVGAPNRDSLRNNSLKASLQSDILGIDEMSYLFTSLMRSQGVNQIFGLYQPRFDVNDSHRKHLKGKRNLQCKLDSKIVHHFKSYVQHEFGNSSHCTENFRVFHCYDMVQLFRFMESCNHAQIEWREKRNYLLGEEVEFEPYADNPKLGTLKVTGFLRGQRPFDIRQPVHITGVGDFLVQQIDGIPMTRPKKVPVLPSQRRAMRKQQRREQSASEEQTPTLKPHQQQQVFSFLDVDSDEDSNMIMHASGQINLDDLNGSAVPSAVANRDEDVEMANANSNAEMVEIEDTGAVDVDVMHEDEEMQEKDTIVLATADTSTQCDLASLREADELGTTRDQSLITEEELREADRHRREQAKQHRTKKFKKEADHLRAWEELFGWESGQESNLSDDNRSDSMQDLIEETDALKISEHEMRDPVEVMLQKKALERDEAEFPDEVEAPLTMRAKDKFAQYRGLKQFSRTKWDKFELLPREYSRISNVSDWKLAKKRAKLNEKMLELGTYPGVQTGRKVCMHIKGVPIVAKSLWENPSNVPTLVWGLLDYEHKISVCHYLVKKCQTYEAPAQGLEKYVFDVGFRRFQARPIFSENSRYDKHLVVKFIKDNDYLVASVYAPVSYPPLPVLMFEDPNSPLTKHRHNPNTVNPVLEDIKEEMEEDFDSDTDTDTEKDELDMYDLDNEATKQLLAEDRRHSGHQWNLFIGNKHKLRKPCDLVATGHLKEVNAHRLLIKRKILTGNPIRVHRRRAVVRYMFWNNLDVNYFKPLELWTKHGLHGKIEEPVGEKGYMKCFFDGHIKQHDTVCLSLYKRIFPIPDPYDRRMDHRG